MSSSSLGLAFPCPLLKRGVKGWQPGFSWSPVGMIVRTVITQTIMSSGWGAVLTPRDADLHFTCFGMKGFPFLFLAGLSDVLNVMWMLYLMVKLFKVTSTRVTFFSPLTFPIACSAHMSWFFVYSVVLLHLFMGLFCWKDNEIKGKVQIVVCCQENAMCKWHLKHLVYVEKGCVAVRPLL